MGSTSVQAPKIEPVNVYKALTDTARAYRDAAPNIVQAEKAIRPEMQKLALADASTALLGDSRQARQDSAAAQAALDEARGERVTLEREIQARIDEIENRKFNPETERNRLRQQKEDYLGFIGDTQKQQRELQKTAGLDDGDIADNAAKAKKLDDVIADYKQAIGVMDAEIAGGDDYLTTEFKKDFDDRNQQDLGKIKLELDNLKTTGALSDEAIEQLEGNATAAADAVLDSNPGMVDLADYAVKRQFETGQELKKAAADNEFSTIARLAPDLVELYRDSDPGSVDIAELASDKATEMIQRPEMLASEPQTALRDLRTQVERTTPGGALGREVQQATSDMLGQGELTTPTAVMQQVRDQVSNLIGGPATSAAEQALLSAGGAAPGGAAQADALSRFGQAQLGATQAPASALETALGTAAQQQLGATQGDPSAAQRAMAGAATRDIAATERGASETERALSQAAQTGLGAGPRAEGSREQALTQAGLDLLQQQAGGPSAVQDAMSAQAMQNMQAGVRGASELEQALGLSAMSGMDAQQRAASPEQVALQSRINELIGGAGRLSGMEQRQVEQEMLALQQRQGRARDTGAAAAVTGRMAEARRADLGQDLAQASALLGQQDALTQARIQEQMQARAMGQQGAVSAAGLEAARQDEMLRQQALGQQGGVAAEQLGLARAQQLAAERQSGAGF